VPDAPPAAPAAADAHADDDDDDEPDPDPPVVVEDLSDDNDGDDGGEPPENDLCMQCKSVVAEMMVTVDDDVPKRLCGACTAAIQQAADDQNAQLPPLPAEPSLQQQRDPRRRTIVAIESIMRLQMEHSATLQRRKQTPASAAAAAAAAPTTWTRAKKRTTTGLTTDKITIGKKQ
jgi:hypothetical protein